MRLASLLIVVLIALLSPATARAEAPEATPTYAEASVPPPAAVGVAPHRDPEVRVARAPRRDPALFGVGIASLVTGAVAVSAGVVLVWISEASVVPVSGNAPPAHDDGLLAAGVITGVAGAALLTAGIVMMVRGGTRVPPSTTSVGAAPGGLRFVF